MGTIISFPTPAAVVEVAAPTTPKRVNASYTTERGAKYDSERSIVDVAKCVRADIKAAIKSGALPAITVGVTSDRFSQGRSLDIVIKSVPVGFEILNAERVLKDFRNEDFNPSQYPLMNESGKGLINALEAIANVYNRVSISNQPDDYSNCSFYLHVTFSGGLRELERECIIDRSTMEVIAEMVAAGAL
jgi:hypothetical protein